MAEMQPDAADEARHLAVLGRVTDETSGFVDDEEIRVVVNYLEQGVNGQQKSDAS